MRTTVKTKSGSIYRFSQGTDGNTYVTRDFQNAGLVTDKVEIRSGERMIISFRPFNPTDGTIGTFESRIQTTPVVEVIID